MLSYLTFLYLFLEFLTNELEKAHIDPRPAGNIGAPDPQELIDLEVREGGIDLKWLPFSFRVSLKSLKPKLKRSTQTRKLLKEIVLISLSCSKSY